MPTVIAFILRICIVNTVFLAVFLHIWQVCDLCQISRILLQNSKMAKMALKWPFLPKMAFARFSSFCKMAVCTGVVALSASLSSLPKMVKNGRFLPGMAF